MNKEAVIELIHNAPKKIFVGALEDSEISDIEKRLNVKLPESYKWFGMSTLNWTKIIGAVA